MQNCPTGKRMFVTQAMAEDALIDSWSRNEYNEGQAPVAIYQCDDCGYFHFTSKGPMNEKLSQNIASGKIKLQREANKWESKWKKR